MKKGTVYGSEVYKEIMKMKPASPTLTDKEVTEVYKRYNLRQYKSEEDFWDKRKKYSDLQNTLDYQFYKHRDELIRSGQYQEWRAGIYQEQYIKTLKFYNVDKDIINKFESLTKVEFGKLYESEKGKGELPTLSVYASDAIIDDAISIMQWQKDMRAFLGMNETKEEHRASWLTQWFPKRYANEVDWTELRRSMQEDKENAEFNKKNPHKDQKSTGNVDAYLASILIRHNDFFATDKSGKQYGFRRGWTRKHSEDTYKYAKEKYTKTGRRKKQYQ